MTTTGAPLLDDPDFEFTSWEDLGVELDDADGDDDFTVEGDTTEQATARETKGDEIKRQIAMKIRYLRWRAHQAIIGMLDPINAAVYPITEDIMDALNGEMPVGP